MTTRVESIVTKKYQGETPQDTYQDLTYGFDAKGNLENLTDLQNSITHAYAYDELDRLLTAAGTGSGAYAHTYAYDAIGNITSKTDVGSYTYTYGSKPHAVRSTSGTVPITTIQYDANGNMTQRTVQGVTQTVTYTADNKPASYTRSGLSVSFTYDGNGQRVRKDTNSQITLYFGEVYERRGATEVFHIFAGNQRIVSLRGTNEQYYHPNHLGSASVITDQNGNRKERIEYFPYGTYRERQDYDGSFPNVNYTFTDQEDDDEIGLYNYKARLYDPLLGRFISADSIVPSPGNLQSLNRYSYCLNNPLLYVDPSGHWFGLDDLVAAGIGAIVGAISAAVSGGNILQGAAIGAAAGWVAYNTCGAVSNQLLTRVVENAWTGEVYSTIGYGTVAIGGGAAGGAAGGAVAGGLHSGIHGGNILEGMGYGALGGGIVGGAAGALGYYGRGLQANYWSDIPDGSMRMAGSGAAGPSPEVEITELARMLCAEGSADYRVPNAFEALGSTARNRVLEQYEGASSYYEVIHQVTTNNKGRSFIQFQSVGNKEWVKFSNPGALRSAVDRAVYQRALNVATGIFKGIMPDPTSSIGGALYFKVGEAGSNPSILQFGSHIFWR